MRLGSQLVVYYSRRGWNLVGGKLQNLTVGNTELAAELIRVLTRADVFHIEPARDYPLDFCRCIDQARQDLLRGVRLELTRWPQGWGGYDTVYLGYPNHWNTLPVAVLSFVEGLDWTGKTMGDYYGAWRAMEELYKEGKIKAIGVCNCYPHVLADLCETVEIRPMVNQVELHPFFQQEDALALMKEYGAVPEAWGPFAEGKHGIFTHPVLTAIGQKYGKSAAQVALRWNVQRGVAVIPKSVHRDRMEQNMNIWDFALSDEDMAEIAKLDIGHSEIVDHFSPAFVKMLHGMKLHP